MPLPTPGDVHVNRPLTNVSIAYIQQASNFIADQVFPVIPSDSQSNLYWEFDRGYWNRSEMKVRGPNDEAAEGKYSTDASSSYFAKLAAVRMGIPDQVRANADAPLNLDRNATLWCTQQALIYRERAFAAGFMAASVWTNDITGVAGAPGGGQVRQWNESSSTPIEDVWAQKENILKSTGMEPNVLVLGYPVYKTLVNHAAFVDRVKYGNTSGVAMIDTSEMAQIFKVDRVLVMRSIENTAVEGATNVHGFIAGKVAGLFYSTPNPGVMMPSAGYIFTWTGYLGAGQAGGRIKKYREEPKARDVVEMEIAFDMKKISADCGAFWNTVVA